MKVSRHQVSTCEKCSRLASASSASSPGFLYERLRSRWKGELLLPPATNIIGGQVTRPSWHIICFCMIYWLSFVLPKKSLQDFCNSNYTWLEIHRYGRKTHKSVVLWPNHHHHHLPKRCIGTLKYQLHMKDSLSHFPLNECVYGHKTVQTNVQFSCLQKICYGINHIKAISWKPQRRRLSYLL